MSEFSSAAITTTTITSATNIVVSIPELVDIIAQHLHQSDYFSCIRVCRAWNDAFIPLLWHTVDTNTQPWKRIMARYKSESSKANIKQWIRAIVAKHGHHIRRLATSWDVLLEAAALGSNSSCKHLYSLATPSLFLDLACAASTGTATPATEVSSAAMVTGTITTATTMATSIPEEATTLRVPFRSLKWDRFMKEGARHRHVIECFYSLVVHNSGLTSLTFLPYASMNDVSGVFWLKTLRPMRHLKELDLSQTSLDLGPLLSNMPQLERLRSAAPRGLFDMQRDYGSLRFLDLCLTCIEISLLHKLLDPLPGLQELRFWAVRREDYTGLSKVLEQLPLFRPLKVLCVDHTAVEDDECIALLVSRFPGLVRARLGDIMQRFVETKRALFGHCYYLEEVHGLDAEEMEAWKQRRDEDAKARKGQCK